MSPHISDTLARLERWMRANEPAFLAAMEPGATDAQLDALERDVGRKLPADVRALYRWRAGASSRPGCPFWERPMTLDEIRDTRREWDTAADTLWRTHDFGPSHWHPGWIPFLADDNEGFICADTEGVWTGTPGQVVEFRYESDRRWVLAPSFGEWLRILVTDLEGNPPDDAKPRYPLGYPLGFDTNVPFTPPPPAASPPPQLLSLALLGDRVRITSGAFTSMEGEVTAVEPGTWQTAVSVVVFGRPIDIRLHADQSTVVERAKHQLDPEEWEKADTTLRLLSLLGLKASVRKLRLLVRACYRNLLAEQSKAEPVLAALDAIDEPGGGARLSRELGEFWVGVGSPEPLAPALGSLRRAASGELALEALVPELGRNGRFDVALVREVFPNPLAAPRFDPAWRTGAAVALARGIDAAEAFDGMPVLADALQEAGCDNDDVLAHCRGNTPHVRGCRVLDLVLGLE